jgi:peptidoglycan/LPS O-acetylase OafA/YrhL
VEVWFYAFWPFIFLLPGKWLVRALLTLIPAFAFFRWHFRGGAPFYFFSQVRFDCMAIGGLAACIFRADHFKQGKQLLDLLCGKRLWALAVLALAASIAFGVSYHSADELVYGLLFSIVMLGAAREERGGVFLNNRILRYAGRVSYGSYCYNWITLVIALLIINQFGDLGSQPLGHLLHYILGFAITFGVATISYRWIEQPFLKLKDRKFQARAPQKATQGTGSINEPTPALLEPST